MFSPDLLINLLFPAFLLKFLIFSILISSLSPLKSIMFTHPLDLKCQREKERKRETEFRTLSLFLFLLCSRHTRSFFILTLQIRMIGPLVILRYVSLLVHENVECNIFYHVIIVKMVIHHHQNGDSPQEATKNIRENKEKLLVLYR